MQITITDHNYDKGDIICILWHARDVIINHFVNCNLSEGDYSTICTRALYYSSKISQIHIEKK